MNVVTPVTSGDLLAHTINTFGYTVQAGIGLVCLGKITELAGRNLLGPRVADATSSTLSTLGWTASGIGLVCGLTFAHMLGWPAWMS